MYTKAELAFIIKKMTPAQKAGQLFFLAFPGKDPAVIAPLIEKYGICGCYISQDNAETFDEASTITQKLQSMSEIPLLLGVDQEGSWGVLIPESNPGPGNLALGATHDLQLVSDIYAMLGTEMLSVGYNAVLAPCSDVNSDPRSPIIGTRSFGEFTERVSACVQAAVKGATGAGVVTSVKHFPGHGATNGDTHRVIPTVDRSLEELMRMDLVPFKAGIDAGVPIVMTSHILFPQIDPDNPATLSSKILNDVLRDKLGFKGVILSDSMNMGAIRRVYDAAESTLLALKAGVDCLMLAEEHYDYNTGGYLEKQLCSLELITHAIESGELPESDVDQKLMRILDLKYNHMQLRSERLSEATYKSNIALAHKAALQAICLVQSNLWPLPASGKVVCINATPRSSYANIVNDRGIGPNQAKPAYDSFKETLSGSGFSFFDYEERGAAAKEITLADAVIVVTEDYPIPGEDFAKTEQQAFVKKLSASCPDKLIIAALRSPYELMYYPENVTYLCAFSSRTCSAQAMAELLASHGKIVPSGKLPVSGRF